MSKKINGEEKNEFVKEKMSSLGVCEAKGAGCKSTITKQIKIKNEPEAGRLRICDSPDCSRKAEEGLIKKLTKAKISN